MPSQSVWPTGETTASLTPNESTTSRRSPSAIRTTWPAPNSWCAAVGSLWTGATCLVLHTTGRASGEVRKSAFVCGFDGDNCLIVASYGGEPKHPGWYLHLVTDPNVTVQVKGDRFAAVARTASGAERKRLWELMNTIWPSYDEYAARTTRQIPVVVLEPVQARASS